VPDRSVSSAMDSARVLGAVKVIVIDMEPYRLEMAAAEGYTTIDFEGEVEEEEEVRSALANNPASGGVEACGCAGSAGLRRADAPGRRG
jgi:threonine dehydrogenase-like Zn-dependent dehydrogenase